MTAYASLLSDAVSRTLYKSLRLMRLQTERELVMSQYVKLVRDGGSIANATSCNAKKTEAEKREEKTDKIIRKGDAVSGQ